MCELLTNLAGGNGSAVIPAAPVAAASTGYPQITLKFRYDYLGRRVEKLVIDTVSNRLISGRRFLYDGWNLIAEYALNASLSTLTLVRSYTWGLDIARTLSEAGGVGALLQIADHPSGKTYFPAYDGNGNIVALVNSSTGTVAAAYEYSPYGEQLRADAPDSVVADQPFRFSTKYTDSETGLVYYGRRYYDPKQGRFVGRDVLQEKGGRNLYGFVRNNPGNVYDYLGMLPVMMSRFVVREDRIWDDRLDLHMDGGGGGGYSFGFDFRGGGGGGDGPTMMAPVVVRASRCRTVSTYGHIGNGNGFFDAAKVLFPSLDSQIIVSQAHKTLAQLANAVYGRAIPEGFDQVDAAGLKALGLDKAVFSDAASGFSASLYRNSATGAYVAAFRGTEADLGDVAADLQQAYGLGSAQFDLATRLGAQLGTALDGNVSFTGHSLGGGLASAAALVANLPAVTFNSAGLHENTLSRAGIDATAALAGADRLITSYSVRGEILNSFQDNNPFAMIPILARMGIGPQAVGFRVTLDPKAEGGPIAQHGMDRVLSALDCPP
jgi:RHS repeat-associated protein